MVDFSNSVFEGKLDPSVPLLNPVEDRSGETFAGALSSGIDSFNKFVFDPNAKAAKADSAKNSIFAEYASEVSLIADAREQGMGMDEAKRHIRVLQNKFLSNNPELTDEFFTFSNKLMTENGLGGNVYKETPEESGNRKYIEEGTAKGWNMSDPESRAAYDRLQLAARDLSVINAEIDRANKNGEVVSARVKERATYGIHALISTAPQWVNDQAKAMFARLEGITDPVLKQAEIDKFQLAYDQEAAQIRQMQSQSGVDASYLLTGTDQMVKNYIAVANGTNDLTAVENHNKSVKAKAEALIMLDEEYATLITMNNLSTFELPSLIQKLDESGLRRYAKLFEKTEVAEDGTVTGKKTADLIAPTEEVAKELDLAKNTIHNIMKAGGEVPPESMVSANDMVVNVMRGAQYYGASDNDPRNFTATVDFLSDPTVGRFIEQNGDSIYPQIAAGAKQIIEQQYGEVVTGLINERYSTAGEAILSGIGSTTNEVDVSDLVEPIWNGVGIEMVAKDQFKADFRVNQLVEDLNRGPNGIVAPLNKLIRMSAHLSGSTDYEKVYNETYKPRLWQTSTEKAKPTMDQMTGKDLTTNKPKVTLQSPIDTDNPLNLKLEDFSDEELQNAIKSSGAKDPEGMMSADNPLAIAKSYLGKTESKSEDVKTLAAFIKNSTGTDINPATTAWCAAFMNAVLGASGGKGTGKLDARSYLTWGVSVDDPQVGDVVVLQRGSGGKNDWRGHVGFYMGTNEDGTIKVLGGNQSDSVSEDNYDANRVLGFRRAG